MNTLPIAISGGGIGGLATALALYQRGFAVEVFEQTAEFKEIGAGIQLGPNVFAMFDRLWITEKISARAVFPDNLAVMDSVTGEPIVMIPVKGAFRERFRNPYALIHRADLHSVLLEECLRCEGITLRASHQVTGFLDRGERVDIELASGEHREAAALIGADGLWSAIREGIVADGPPRVSGHIAYRAVLPIAEVPEHLRLNNMTLWAGPKNHLVHYPLRGFELFNLVAVFHSERYVEGWDSKGDPEELHRRFAGVVPDVKTMLGKVNAWRMWVLCDREPVREWSKGRVTLLGDAAHPMLQYLAQGACMAIEDAVVLAEEMQSAKGDFASAFIKYQDRRYLRTGRVQLTARLYGEVYHAAGAAREIRNQFLRDRSPEQARESMAWLYDGIG
jgi:2-polyprenyl-6-methoxyphenol hydroxylase-like FAD-dependent oxidoreductase